MACPRLASSDRSIAAYTAANTGRIFNRILRPASESGREAIGPVEAEGALQPGQCLRGSTRPHKDGAAEGIVVGIARIELEHAVDLCEGGEICSREATPQTDETWRISATPISVILSVRGSHRTINTGRVTGAGSFAALRTTRERPCSTQES